MSSESVDFHPATSATRKAEYQTWKIMNTGTSDLKIAGTNAGAFNQYVPVDNTVSSGITATNTAAYSVTLTLARTALGLDITAGFGSFTAPAFSIAHANVLTYTFDQAVITGSSALGGGTSNFDNVLIFALPSLALRAIRRPRGRLAISAVGWYRRSTVKQYRPNVERQKELYSRMKAREIFRRMSGRTKAPGTRRIPDNSEPWLPGGVHSVADALYISDRIQEDIVKWRLSNSPPT